MPRRRAQSYCNTNGHVYILVRCDGLVKVGQTTNLARRMMQHRSATGPFEIIAVMEAGMEHERHVQDAMAGWRVGRSELFALPQREVDRIRDHFAADLKTHLDREGVDSAYYNLNLPSERRFRKNPFRGVCV